MDISEVFSGAPEDDSQRGLVERNTYALLNRLGISFHRVDHAPAATLELCAEIDKRLQTHICKNLFLCNRQKTAYYLLLLEGDKVFKTKYLSAQIGSSRLSFASQEDMEELLGVTPGSASVFSLMNDTKHQVQLLIDQPLLQHETLGFHPCINTSSLKVKLSDLIHVFLPAVDHDFLTVNLPEVEENA